MLGMQDDISDLELKQRWRLYWIHSIFEFSNIKLQELSWIQGSKADWPNEEVWESSYQECISSYFDTLGLYDAYEKALKSSHISHEELDAAREFHTLAAFYEEPSQDPEIILKDEEWLELVASAKEFWEYLKNRVTSPREIELVQKLEKFSKEIQNIS